MFPFMAGYAAAERAARRAAAVSASSPTGGGDFERILDVDARIDRLLLVVEAMWTLLRESGYTDEQLKAAIDQLDGADGTADGRRSRAPRPCPKCNSMVEAVRSSCAICGHDMPIDPTVFAPDV